ncbi:hypothetical protein GCM10011335_13680 [Aureimonas glaciei]|uniref:Uncharacterized protein n=2 Tax=Aureimonas glaciei TaxID=1776957 RepID=A0A916XU63_9HYPH|nr:hypothetical protein GCM10011335_13680 [Aureimonas glaciei]
MRLLAQSGLITPLNNDISRGKVAYYSREEVAKARLLLQLYEITSTTRTLRDLEFAFFGLDIGMRPRPDWNGAELARHLKVVLEKIAAGEEWVFDVTLKADASGRLVSASYFRLAQEPRVRDTHRADIVAFEAAQGQRLLAQIELPATDLLKPLLDKIAG